MLFFRKQRPDRPLQKVCRNCSNPWQEGDKYCRFCGAPMDAPTYIQLEMQCIYGPPPVRRRHVCAQCGYAWETCAMIDRETHCPRCGGDAPASGEEEILEQELEEV